MPIPSFETLSTELEAALLRALADTWHELNQTYFKGRLRPPAIALIDGRGRLGEWRAAGRTLALSRALVVDRPWGVVVEVLKHEIAHQYVAEVLGEPDGTAHGPSFRDLCERLGIDARAAGLPEAGPGVVPGETETRILGRIAKLLALSQSQNRHEAEAAMAMAQELMLKHNLEALPGQRDYGWKHLGAPMGRKTEAERILANLLADHFFVEVIWIPVWRAREGKRGSVLEVCGRPVNLEMAAFVHDFLVATADRLWADYKRAQRIASNRDRQTFLSGVMSGFRDKLEAQARTSAEAGLVWIADGDLQRYHRRRHPHVRWTRSAGARQTEAHAHGRAAGRDIVLTRPIESHAMRGRLLTGR